AFGCPFEGPVPVETVVRCCAEMAEAGAGEIALADTIGVAVPADVRARIAAVRAEIGDDIPLRAHFHDTRGMGMANAWAAYEAGVSVLDSSLGGLGGCPFAPNATGNIATEDLVYLLETSGVGTGVDLQAAIDTNHWFEPIIGKPLPSVVAKAGIPTGWLNLIAKKAPPISA
ncbi:MAG: hydroxymethylglutaryl-CoA lyase, partial [Pseudomonadota bacterium]